MEINIIEQNNDEPLIIYKLPDFINENKDMGDKPDDFQIMQILGHGSFSQVLKVKSKKNFIIYAMKKINMTRILLKYGRKKYFMNEVRFLEILDHPNVIKCYKIFRNEEGGEDFLYFIMEYMNNADLGSFNKANSLFKTFIPEAKLWDIFCKCLTGLNYIHKNGIIHRDIKPTNLFLNDDFKIKIGDFNISAVIDKDAAIYFSNSEEEIDDLLSTKTKLGTNGYMAPEVVEKKPYDQKADIFSMGKTFYELCYGWNSIYNDKYNNGFKPSKEMKNLIIKMVDYDPKKRPTCEEALFEAKSNFIKCYLKNSSIEASFNCFNNFKNFKDCFHSPEMVNFVLDNQKELTQMCLNIALLMENNDKNISPNEKIQIDEGLYNLRQILGKEGLNIVSDNIEIDPVEFITFFIKKLNCELNEITSDNNINNNKPKEEQEKEEIIRFKLLSKSFHFKPENKKYYFNLIINAYNKKILSFISRNFYSYIITERTCVYCNTKRYYFSHLYFIPINVTILRQKKGSYNNNISLKDGFNCMENTCINIGEEKQLACGICDKISKFKEKKNFYRTAKNLIIIFDRGEKAENNSFVDFNEDLTLNNFGADGVYQVNYKLVGIVSKLKEEYLSFIKTDYFWISSNRNQINFNDAKKFGTVIALFYYSEDKNLPLENRENINLASINLDDQIFVDTQFFIRHKTSLFNNNNVNINPNNNNNQQFIDFGNISSIQPNDNVSNFSGISNLFNNTNQNSNNNNNQNNDMRFGQPIEWL